MGMKVYSREKLIKRLKICVVLGAILAVVSTVAIIGLAYIAGEATVGEMLFGAPMLVFLAIAYTLAFFGASFNFGKMMLGFIAPIPIVSCCIECIKSWIYAIKGIIVILKKQEQLVIGSADDSDNNSDD